MSQNLTTYPISQMPNITSPDPHPNLPFSVIRICPSTLPGMVRASTELSRMSLSNHFGFRCRLGPARLQTGRIRISRLPYIPAHISQHRQDNFQPRFPYENRCCLIIFPHFPSISPFNHPTVSPSNSPTLQMSKATGNTLYQY